VRKIILLKLWEAFSMWDSKKTEYNTQAETLYIHDNLITPIIFSLIHGLISPFKQI